MISIQAISMKNKELLCFILVTFILLLLQTNSHAQIKDVKWEPWMQHPCYKGLSVSVLKMGLAKEAEAYLWGLRIRNDYDTAVTFKYDLTIGTEKIKGGIRIANKLKPGETWTDGGDSATANIFKNSSNDWTVGLGELCFDGMCCGGDEDCHAACDVVEKKINQPCGQQVKTGTKIQSGVWISMARSKSEIQSKIELTKSGLIFTRSGISFEFSKISEVEYEWVQGKDYRLKIKDDTHIVLLHDGDNVYPYFTFQSNSSLSDDIKYKDFEDPLFFEGDWVNNADKKKMKITIIKEGISLKKTGESILQLYIIMPNLNYRSSSEKDKFISLSGANYQSLIFYHGFKNVDTYTRLKPFVLKKPVMKQ